MLMPCVFINKKFAIVKRNEKLMNGGVEKNENMVICVENNDEKYT